MHEAFWNGLLDVRWEDAPLGPETTRLVLRLRECGYAEPTCRDYGHAVIHLGRVLREETGGVEGVRDDAVIEDFLGRHLRVCRCYRRRAGRQQEKVRRGLAHLRAMLRDEGAIPAVVPDEPPYQGLIEGYSRFLRRDRGLAETTVVNYRRYLRDFLASRGDAVSPAELVAEPPSLSLLPSPGHAAAEPGARLDAGQDSAPGRGLDPRYEQLRHAALHARAEAFPLGIGVLKLLIGRGQVHGILVPALCHVSHLVSPPVSEVTPLKLQSRAGGGGVTGAVSVFVYLSCNRSARR